jgi:hypothetical protein
MQQLRHNAKTARLRTHVHEIRGLRNILIGTAHNGGYFSVSFSSIRRFCARASGVFSGLIG